MPSSTDPYNLIVIVGPTATGKTSFAAQLAYQINAEIISADSRQIYRQMDLGTGKDYQDYLVNDTQIPFHLIDINDPGYKYNVYEYQLDFVKSFESIRSREKKVILCGGTGMYIEAVTKGYKLIAVPVNKSLREQLENKTLQELEVILKGYKKLHNRSDSDTKKRAIRAIEIEEYYSQHPEIDLSYPNIIPVFIGLQCDREVRRQGITSRLKTRLEEGMVEEVEMLLKQGIPPQDLIYYGLEYKYITLYLTGEIKYETMVERLNSAIHQFAKRQMTWFRKMERNGIKINWINSQWSMEGKLENAKKILADYI